MTTVKAKPAKQEDTLDGMILYSDGSSAPSNPGFGGWGLHGYSYSDQAPKKGSGNASQILTTAGYADKSAGKAAGATEIKPLTYIDGYGSFLLPVTNNVAEIAGVTNGLAYALGHDIKALTILTDSMYTIDGATKWINGWKKNNWIKQDGQPVANKDMWLTLSNNLTQLQAKGVDVQIKWVKGHSVHLGNQIADKHADIGNRYSRLGQLRTQFNVSPADGYWTPKGEKHPFLAQRRIFFSTLPESLVPGEYYLGEHGKDDELIGKRTADGAHSYVELSTPEPLIEMLRNKQLLLASGADAIVMGRLDKLFAPDTQKDLLSFGDIMLYQQHRYKLDLHLLGADSAPRSKDKDDKEGEPVTKELKPPRLAMRAIEAVNTLKGVLLAWKDKERTDITSTDITPVLFDIDDKGEYKLKAEFIVGFTGFTVSANCGPAELSKAIKLDLFMGIDIPERNAIKRMEKLKPCVQLVTWFESEKTVRYATIIQSYDNFGIWAGMHSNLRVLV